MTKSRITGTYLILTHPTQYYNDSKSAQACMQKLADRFDPVRTIELYCTPDDGYVKHRGNKCHHLYAAVLQKILEENVFVCCGGNWGGCHRAHVASPLVDAARKKQKDIELVFPLDGIFSWEENLSGQPSDELLKDFEEFYVRLIDGKTAGECSRYEVFVDGERLRVINNRYSPLVTVSMFRDVDRTLRHLREERKKQPLPLQILPESISSNET